MEGGGRGLNTTALIGCGSLCLATRTRPGGHGGLHSFVGVFRGLRARSTTLPQTKKGAFVSWIVSFMT